jgi:peptidoglycan/LPS O-acetylase OafA/YrhL
VLRLGNFGFSASPSHFSPSAKISAGMRARDTPTGRYHPEIQGLRAVAVVAVVIFHVWPSTFSGGFVGVDIFFVISGFLIVGILVEEIHRDGHIAFASFYARRIRRILPSATLVLLAIALALPLLPKFMWEQTATELAASGAYVENWVLWHLVVDYFGQSGSPTPVTHYWSLSVEEQFYLVWPALLVLCAYCAQRLGWPLHESFAAMLCGVVIVSFTYAVAITEARPAQAFFDTGARAWEFALGGALAVWRKWKAAPQPLQFALGWAGIVLISIAVLAFDREVRFPGYMALVPTLGALCVILGGQRGTRFSACQMLSTRPLRIVGDLSYAAYLWHWPIVVFYIAKSGREPGLLRGLILIGICLAFAFATTRWIETPIRRGRFSLTSTFALGLGCVVVSLLASGAMFKYMHFEQWRGDAAQADHPGAEALLSIVPAKTTNFVPTLFDVKKDLSIAVTDGCHGDFLATLPRGCSYGPAFPTKHVFLVGDSHAAQWSSTLLVLGRQLGWKITIRTKAACPFTKAHLRFKNGAEYQACSQWNANLLREILDERPDLVVASAARFHSVLGEPDPSASLPKMVEGTTAIWRRVFDAGIPLIAIRDTPRFPFDVPECLSRHEEEPAQCAGKRSDVMRAADPLLVAAQNLPGTRVIDATDWFCYQEICPPIIGSVLVWQDDHHMTATYAKTLATHLKQQLLYYLSFNDLAFQGRPRGH